MTGRHVAGIGSGGAMRRTLSLLAAVLLAGALVAAGPRAEAAQARLTASAVGHPHAAKAPTIAFHDVAATSATNAWIVGTSRTAPGPVRTMIAHWNGRAWRRVPSPNAAGRKSVFSILLGVAATSRRNAWAVGEASVHNTSTLIERWNGTAWKIVPSPDATRGHNVLGAIAATSARDAWAVGYATTGPGSASRTLVEHWNGRAWRLVPSPNAPNAGPGIQVQNGLGSVTAISPSNAWAVGVYIVGSNPPQTLIEHWNGKKWAIVPSPDPLGASSPSELSGVAAVSAADVFAVGSAGDSFAPTRTMIVRWRGTGWHAMPSPGSPQVEEGLSAVSAISARDAWAVGFYDSQTSSKNRVLILHWNGSTWRAVRSPFPRGAISAGLSSVAAVSARAAWAVGSAQGGPHRGPLLMRWNGTRWAIVAVHL